VRAVMAMAYPAGQGPAVRLVTPRPGGYPAPRRRADGSRSGRPARRARAGSGRRITAWIVRAVMGATAAFALVDLFLLTSAVHH